MLGPLWTALKQQQYINRFMLQVFQGRKTIVSLGAGNRFDAG